MKVRYKDPTLEALRKGSGDGAYPAGVAKAYRKRLQVLEAAPDERVLREWKSLHFEQYEDVHSIRLNDQWRLLLDFEGEGSEKVVVVVAITDYH